MGKERKPNPLIGVLSIVCLLCLFLASNWQELFGYAPITNNSSVSKSNTFADEGGTAIAIAVPNTDTNIIDSVVKILIVKWGFETTLLAITITAAVLTMVLLAKLGVGGKYAVRGGVVATTIAGYYIALFNPISYLLIVPVSILLILAAFSFSFSSGEKTEISSDGGRKESKYNRISFKD